MTSVPPASFVPESCAPELIAASARRAPLDPAVVFGGRTWTYRDLSAETARWAAAVTAAGVRPGEVVGICLRRSPDMVAAVLGILGAGCAYLPLDPDYPAERLCYMATDAGLRVVATEPGLASLVARFSPTVVPVDRDDLPEASDAGTAVPPRRPPVDTAPAVVIYTSGSTGRPKGVVVPHRALTNFVGGMSRQLSITAADTVLAQAPLSFDISIFELILPLTVGARVHLVDRATATDGPALAAAIAEGGVTVVQGTPTTHRMLLLAGWVPGADQTVVSGGEPLPPDVAEGLTAGGARLWNSYGPTETTVYTHALPMAPGQPVRIGGPLPNVREYLLDADANPVPVGVTGEIWIGGHCLATGYLHRPDLTADRFRPDPFADQPGERLYRTGDLARWTGGGRLEPLGRADQQLKLRGYRIEPGEIEAVLRAGGGIADAVVSLATEGSERFLVARVVLASGKRPSRDELREPLIDRLPAYMIPARFIEVDRLPMTPSGKVDRAAAAVLAGRPIEGGDHTRARTPVEHVVAGVWLDLLGVEDLGVHEPVFHLGATSVMVQTAANLLTDIFAVPVGVRDLFDRPSVATQADHVLSLRQDATGIAERLLHIATVTS
jgi:amino acid adenylation domain-containing protein